MIKHISFDLWLTLIKSHPEYKKQRADFLRREFNPHGFSLQEVIEIVQTTDKVSDRINEINGKKLQTELMYKRILLKLGNKPELINNDLLVEIKMAGNKLFMNYQPEFLNTSIHSMLDTLKARGFDLNLSSNTGFIEGNTVSSTLKNLNIYDYFNFFVYSDEINASKPSFDFFDKVYKQINFQKNEILHVGDNYKADYEGALKYGFKALHINNKQYTINDITKYL
jgi:putative hydrolase of the HAD superfamily